MSKYEGRFKAIERKIPKEQMNGYSFFEESPGIYEDECRNIYTREELNELKCLLILYPEWYKYVPEKEPTDDERARIKRSMKEYRRLQYLYDPDRKRYGLKPPFASADPEDIPEGCTAGWNEKPMTAYELEDERD